MVARGGLTRTVPVALDRTFRSNDEAVIKATGTAALIVRLMLPFTW
jgi:hypothetical protein